jgi:hypothetical protein
MGMAMHAKKSLNKASMFGLFKKDPAKKLQEKRSRLLKEAMEIQRSGDLKLYALRMKEIDDLEKDIESLGK